MKKRLREEIEEEEEEEEDHYQNGDGDHEPRPEQSIYPNAGKWVRGRLLGWGAFGWVYLAIMKEQGSRFTGFCPRVMAVKSSYTSQSEELKKEKVLLDVLADSPFIIRCFGDDITIADDNREVLNVFLEYASGGSLANLIENSKGLGLREQQVKRYTESILRGIQCIHEMGFVHCDLKPENILLVKEGDNDDDFVAKIADFGLSKRADNWVSTTPALGTREYLAPECRINKIQEQCSDIWALGCIVLKMLTTRLIWDSNASNSISREANDFLIKCFESNPNVRPSAETLLSHPFVCGLEIIDLTSEEEVIEEEEEEEVEEYQCEEEEDIEEEEEYLEEETEEVEEEIEVRPCEEEEEDLCEEEEEIEQDPFCIYQWEVEKEEDPEEEIGEYQCEEEGVEEDDLEEEIEKNPEEGEEEREVYTYEEEEEVEHDPLHIYQREEDEEAEEDPFEEEEEECGYLTPTICLKQPVFTGIGAASS